MRKFIQLYDKNNEVYGIIPADRIIEVKRSRKSGYATEVVCTGDDLVSNKLLSYPTKQSFQSVYLELQKS